MPKDTQQNASQAIKDEAVVGLLEQLGKALNDGDAAAAARCFDAPALVLASEGTRGFTDSKQIEDLFRQAVQAYRANGVVTTKPELTRSEPLSEDLIAVDVRWPGFDEQGVERMSERSHYILQLANDGQPRIRVALTRTVGR